MLNIIIPKNRLFSRLFQQCRQEILRLVARQKVDTESIDGLLNRDDNSSCPVGPEDVYTLESFLIDHLEIGQLKLKSIVLRDMLRSQMTATSYTLLSEHFLKFEPSIGKEEWRQEVHELCCRLYRRYGTVPAVESQRSQVAIMLLSGTALLGLLMALTGWLIGLQEGSMLILSVMFAGACGASVSTLMRLYKIDPKNEPGSIWLSIQYGIKTIFVAPVIGMIFALVMYLLIRANLLSGALFPQQGSKMFETQGMFSLLLAFGPCDSDKGMAEACQDGLDAISDMVKFWIWAFCAGWAERLVPDVLDRLTQKGVDSVSPR